VEPQKLVIIGAGGFGRDVLDVVEAVNRQTRAVDVQRFDVVGFLDDGNPDLALLEPYGVPLLGPVSQLAELPDDVGYVIGIGDPAVRRRLDALGGGRACPVLVDPTATMTRRVELGPGTVICAGARLSNHLRLGRHVHVNVNCTVGHDATLGDYVTLSPLVAISGNVIAETGAFFGTGARVNPGLTVGTHAVVGTGAAVIRDVPGHSTVVGVPAKPR
jgi:sugar O-acyltransferase (sialic acid O-acetyltransferase NeuD family)